jgi:hypothetical protein
VFTLPAEAFPAQALAPGAPRTEIPAEERPAAGAPQRFLPSEHRKAVYRAGAGVNQLSVTVHFTCNGNYTGSA